MKENLTNDLQELALSTAVSSLIRRPALECPDFYPVGAALALMQNQGVGSIVVMNGLRPVGILTRVDLIERIILPKLELTTPIAQVMSHGLVVVPEQTTVLEAMILMAERRIRHLPVEGSNGLLGVVSESDLMRHQRSSLGSLSARLGHAPNLGELAKTMVQVRQLAKRLIRDGLSAGSSARLMSHLNDAATRRVIELVLSEKAGAEIAETPWVWLALGSEGREEQTIATDQDNALLFVGDDSLYQDDFLALADEVNRGLDRIGFPLCKGGVMARNPFWCRSMEGWVEQVEQWLDKPTPEALLAAHTFFDFRPLFGDLGLAQQLRKAIQDAIKRRSVGGPSAFLSMMAADALRSELTSFKREMLFGSVAAWMRRRGWSADWLARRQVDIKLRGTAPAVAWTRVLALAHHVSDTGTEDRISALEAQGVIGPSDSAQMRSGFDALQRARFVVQSKGRHEPNAVQIEELNQFELEELDRAMEDLGQLRALLELSFPNSRTGV